MASPVMESVRGSYRPSCRLRHVVPDTRPAQAVLAILLGLSVLAGAGCERSAGRGQSRAGEAVLRQRSGPVAKAWVAALAQANRAEASAEEAARAVTGVQGAVAAGDREAASRASDSAADAARRAREAAVAAREQADAANRLAQEAHDVALGAAGGGNEEVRKILRGIDSAAEQAQQAAQRAENARQAAAGHAASARSLAAATAAGTAGAAGGQAEPSPPAGAPAESVVAAPQPQEQAKPDAGGPVPKSPVPEAREAGEADAGPASGLGPQTEQAVQQPEAVQSNAAEPVTGKESAAQGPALPADPSAGVESRSGPDTERPSAPATPPSGDAPRPPTGDGRRPSAIDPRQIPSLPPAPPATTRSKPEGVVRPPPEPPSPPEVRGRWRQVEGDMGPDFLPGGYVTSVLAFRFDGLLEVRRVFGKERDFQQTWRVGYEWDKEHKRLTLGRDPKRRPPPESLKGFSLGEGAATILAAKEPLPLVLPCERLEKGRLRIGDKVYEPVADPLPAKTGK